MTFHHHIEGISLDPYVNGARRKISGDVHPTYDPATGEVLCEVPVSDASVVDEAVEASRAALKGAWANVTPAERSRMLFRVAQFIRADAQRLATVECIDSGKPLREAVGDIETSARYFEYYAGIADKLQGDTIPLGKDFVSFTLHEPIGATAHIIPWNFPLVTTARGLAPALAAGATAVIKPAEQTPLTALMLPEYLEKAGIPAGVVNVVCGPGRTTGSALTQHPGIAHVTFTGSVATGKTVMMAAASHVASVTMELGGKSPVVVLADADREAALEGVLKAIFTNAGQVCSAGSRLVVERSIADSFLASLVERIGAFTFGRGLDNPNIGPVVSKDQLAKIETIVNDSVAAGATLLTGGRVKKPDGLNGWFFEPTVLVAHEPSTKCAQEEIFGPVLTVQIAENFEHACELAEGTEFGLVAGIYTKDVSKALKFSRHVSSGQVFINQYFAGGVETPFGGTKNSGFGREKGLEGLKAYYTVKTVTARI
ncbi:aldehyde dehydrogenase family protein [Pseudaminobacter sp. 19-2017]|uniref:Aldehyde dehydrogenase family protein n=1 Tax=Pseudaminobacter soli (ex Zhang et al. 2022) TaxID=2831468 RepID=A0A942E395_9HYPH|nr:aldehyde dehydrogenase family protein [Pseudaminobacter soli]MBS3650201.1 aldehyde dehydrogenase family protein [Pseudaminobacter soli]